MLRGIKTTEVITFCLIVLTLNSFFFRVLQRANQEMKAGDEFKMNYRSFRTDMAKNPNFEDFLTNHVCDPMKEGFVELDNHTPHEILQTNI